MVGSSAPPPFNAVSSSSSNSLSPPNKKRPRTDKDDLVFVRVEQDESLVCYDQGLQQAFRNHFESSPRPALVDFSVKTAGTIPWEYQIEDFDHLRVYQGNPLEDKGQYPYVVQRNKVTFRERRVGEFPIYYFHSLQSSDTIRQFSLLNI